MPSGVGKHAGHGPWMIFVIVGLFLSVQIAKFAHGLFDRTVFAFTDSLLILIFTIFLCWSLVHGYRWARYGLAYFALAMLVTSDGSLLRFGAEIGLFDILCNTVYLAVACGLIFAPLAMLAALETARTAPLGPDEVLSERAARRRGRFILVGMIAAAFLFQLTWMLPAWWRVGTQPGLVEGLVAAIFAMVAYGLWRRSENARAWAWLLSFAACFWFLVLGVLAPEPNDFFIAIGLAHLAIPSALASWRSVQAYFGDADLDAKWEYVQPTPRRPKAWGEELGSAESTGTKSLHRGF